MFDIEAIALYQNLIRFQRRMIAHCMNMPPFVHSFSYGWIFELFPLFGIMNNTTLNIHVQVSV